jgi:hypothetical protein
MFPIEHCEKFISPDSATGLIKNFESASQVVVLSGQQGLVSLHPSVHYEQKVGQQQEVEGGFDLIHTSC